MKIVADENIVGLREYFSAYGEIVSLPGRQISSRDVIDADALLVRSVTTVNQTLLEKSSVCFVGSCTIGTDHLDTLWLHQQKISWGYAPGCNARAVVDYVLSCLLTLKLDLSLITVGIVGCGNVGGLLGSRLGQLGIRTLLCDPFLSDTQNKKYLPLKAILPLCDVLCLHTPLTQTGAYPTYHLMNADNLTLMQKNAVLLNAGRGAVVDNLALLEHMQQHPDFRAVLDVWEHEPAISKVLLERTSIATPHIAGYSLAGKWRGSAIIHQSFCEHFRLPPQAIPVLPKLYASIRPRELSLRDYVLGIYDVAEDSRQLKATASLEDGARGIAFDHLRKHYPHRLEMGDLSSRA